MFPKPETRSGRILSMVYNQDIKQSENLLEHNDANSSKKDVSEKSNVKRRLNFEAAERRQNICAIETTCSATKKTAQESNKHFCFYCHKLVSKIARHLQMMHKNEEDVVKFLNLPAGCTDRKRIIETIRRNGDFIHNRSLKHGNLDELITCRRPQYNKIRAPDHYVVCPHCKGFFSKLALRKHHKICCEGSKFTGRRSLLVLSRKLYMDVHKKANERLKTKILPVLREDEISNIIKHDELAIIYGNRMSQNYHSEHHHKMIRTRLRLIGRFITEIRKINKSISDFASVSNPNYYDNVIEAINKVAQLNESTGKYKAPSTAFALGTALKYIGNLLVLEHVKSRDVYGQKKVENFIKLINVDLSCTVNKTVIENQKEYKRQKNIVLPSNEDIKLLNSYLKKQRDIFLRKLQNKFDFADWMQLSSFTLISILVFNRRRPGELERALISDFNAYESVNEKSNHDIYTNLSLESREAIKRYVRFVISGKLARTVPVLLHRDHLSCLKLIIKLRNEANVPYDNPYIFGIPGSSNNNHLNANCLLRKYSSLCGAENLCVLRATHLRKHVATQSVLLNLKENEVSDLATFLGHAEKIHKQYYRLPITTREITQMSRILELAQGNNISDGDEFEDEAGSFNSSLDECSGLNDSNKNEDENFNSGLDESFSSDEFNKNDILNEIQSSSSVSDHTVTSTAYIQRRTWNTPEKRAARRLLTKFSDINKNPSYKECDDFISENKILQNRTPAQLKLWLINQKKLAMRTPNKRTGKKSWTTPERHTIREVFKENLATRTLPSLAECRQACESNKTLRRRNPVLVKAFVNNEVNRLKRFQ